MENIIRKITSRKFLLALLGVVAGLAMAFGVTGDEITNTVTTVAGVVTALGSIVSFHSAESKVDAAAARKEHTDGNETESH